jgi:DNA modification methylase
MPTLDFQGKAIAQTLHQNLPLHQLVHDPALSHTARPALDDNLIIQGDNLLALRALLPSFAGQIKCIYIDPPYNTGHTNWSYEDSAGDGARRHDAWLCMLLPRLQLLRALLREDGAIFISIDDHEIHRLRLLLDEVFGPEQFIATVIWQKMFAPKNSARHFSQDHDYIVVYAKRRAAWSPHLLPRSAAMDQRYTNRDGDPRGPWAPDNLTARNRYTRGEYEVTSPSGRTFRQPVGTYWRISAEKFRALDQDRRIWWGINGDKMPRLKRFLSEVKRGVVPQTLWPHTAVGHTQDAKRELLDILDFERTEAVFVTPKPTALIQRILQIATDRDSLILDAFAGSGTTAHAALALNAADGGSRRFILIEQADYAGSLTAERVRRVISGVPSARDRALRGGYGGSFTFFRLEPSADAPASD